MALVERFIEASFSLSEGSSGVNAGTLNYAGLRMSANVTLAGSAYCHLHLSIFGMTLSEMNALSYIPFTTNSTSQNTILVRAGDKINGMSDIFEGTIIQAWPNMQNAPEVSFDVEAMIGAYNGVRPANPPYLSFTGATDVATIAKKIASIHEPPLTFENNGVDMKIDSPYFSGSPRNMMHQLGKITKMGWIEELGTLAIWPQGGGRQEAGTMTIEPPIMVGYPVAVPGYIVVKKIHERTIKYASQVTIKSDLTRACGTWNVYYVNYELDSLMPHGRWFDTLFCSPLGATQPPPPQQ